MININKLQSFRKGERIKLAFKKNVQRDVKKQNKILFFIQRALRVQLDQCASYESHGLECHKNRIYVCL